MPSTLRSDRRALRLSSLALAGAVMLAACETDKSMAPNPVMSTPIAPSLAKASGAQSLTITVVDQNSSPVTTLAARFKVTNSAGGPGLLIVDNTNSDGNSAVGTIQMKGLASGTYEVCQTIAPTDYVLPTVPCKNVIVGGIVAASAQFVDLTVARATWRTTDFLQNQVGGAAFKVFDGVTWSTITDNSSADLDPALGSFATKSPNGAYNICPKTPPTGWVFMATSCVGVQTPHGQTTDLGAYAVNPEFSVYFYATNFDVTVGPSEYEIKSVSGKYALKLVDDGMNDMWKGVAGKMWIKLPAAGDYTICQTVAPPNTEIADPACKTVTIKLGVLEYAGFFNSKPL